MAVTVTELQDGFPIHDDWTTANRNRAIHAGSRFRRVYALIQSDGTELDTTGYEARAHVRPTHDSDTLTLEMNSATNGRIVMNQTVTGTNGVTYTKALVIQVSATVTAPLTPGFYGYDLELIPPSGEADVFKIAWGDVDIVGEFTR